MSMRPSDNLAYRIMKNYRPTKTVIENTECNNNSFFKRKEDTPEQKTKTDVVSEIVTRIRNQRESIRNGRTDIT